jgi:serine/threonine protein phosphatase 1
MFGDSPSNFRLGLWTTSEGDVHGNREALDDLLSRLEVELQPIDTVVFLGDNIDRGPDSSGCIERILRFRAETPATVVTLLGNHEDSFLRTSEDPSRYSWLTVMEGLATVRSYSTTAADALEEAVVAAGSRLVLERVSLPYRAFFEAIPSEHLAFFKGLRTFWRTREAVCVHGGLDPQSGPVESQSRDVMVWGHPKWPGDYAGPDLVMYGHCDNAELTADGWPSPAMGPASIGIDTISHGILTACVLPGRRVLQSRRFVQEAV